MLVGILFLAAGIGSAVLQSLYSFANSFFIITMDDLLTNNDNRDTPATVLIKLPSGSIGHLDIKLPVRDIGLLEKAPGLLAIGAPVRGIQADV